MKNIFAILGGLGAGAALMYLFDPDRGNRRRALIADKANSFSRKTKRTVEGRANDLRNRTKGLLHEARSAFKHQSEELPKEQPTM